MSKVFSVCITITMLFIVFGGLVLAIGKAAALPDVHFSYSTQNCVKVVNYTDDQFTCDNLPKRFYHVWVE
jgi:hypothetical protein